jgi:hypothetical protein
MGLESGKNLFLIPDQKGTGSRIRNNVINKPNAVTALSRTAVTVIQRRRIRIGVRFQMRIDFRSGVEL